MKMQEAVQELRRRMPVCSRCHWKYEGSDSEKCKPCLGMFQVETNNFRREIVSRPSFVGLRLSLEEAIRGGR